MTRSSPSEWHAPEWPAPFAERYIARGYWGRQSFAEAFLETARHHADRVALNADDSAVRYGELLSRSQRLAAGLRQAGLAEGDNVVLHLPNGVAFIETCLALFQLGVRPVFALPAHRRHEIEGLCRASEAKAYIGADKVDAFDPRPMAHHLIESGLCDMALIHGEAEAPLRDIRPLYQSPPLSEIVPDAADIACFQLSGGTTGTPKLIPRRHREYLYNVRASIEVCGFDAQTVYLTALPIAHNFTLCCPGVIGTLLAGGRVVISQRADPEHCFPLIARERVTHTALVPPLAMLWLDAQSQRQADLSSLRLLQVGGSKLGSNAARRVAPVLGCALQQVLGMAEGLVCYTRLDDPLDRILHTQGRPLSPDDEIRITDREGRPVADGEVGELQVRGPYTIRGYYRMPEHNATAFTAEGFYRTGDLVKRDANGYLTVEGRDKDQINRGGEKVAAEEVENLLIAHPLVHDAAVVAMPDDRLGERVCAFVVPRQPAPSALKLKRYLLDHGLAQFKVPDRIELVDAFPQTGIGKISKKDLRQHLRQSLEVHA
ncbi:(2,3-dihydroxybenzoyl)adenylate synthase [Rhodospirillum sp. A1_3_36]|uniref:(2,3-dihydroxybenzoyl)adenylate synthase n=1 Tax=Rhodospirillum sp. A1_3_36 TaxID=3391666 RepID=UPI0039A774F9